MPYATPPAVKRFFASFAPIFTPPFDGLIWLVVLYFTWCFFVYPDSQTLRGNLPDPDDYMYLTQVLDWLNGQGWYDNVQHRLNPPEGVPIHFSRFAQAPMALLILGFRALGLGPRAASMITAMIYPPMLLGGFLVALRWLAASFVPQKWAGASAYVALFAIATVFMFMPGHVDHHNLVILLVAVTLGFVMRMAEKPAEPLWGLGAGLVMALNLTVALEILPWLLIISGWMGVWSATKGGKASINALAYALGLHLGSVVFLGLTRPPLEWFTPDVLTYSIVYVFLTGGVAVCFAALAVAAKQNIGLRWLTGAVFAGLTGYLFLHRFPEMISGPYGGIDPQLTSILLEDVGEAQPLIHNHRTPMELVAYLSAATIGLIASGIFLRRAGTATERWKWGLLLAMQSAAVGLTVFYQHRFTGMMGFLTVVPLTVLLQRSWRYVGANFTDRRKVFAEIGLLLLVGPLPGVFIPALIDGRAFNTGVLLFPVDSSVKQTPCDEYQLEKILANPRFFGDRPRLVMAPMSLGPELMFRTPHRALAAPYHMDVTGNIDSTRFFSTPYVAEAEAIARRRHIDLVVACRFVPDILTRAPAEAIAEAKTAPKAAATGASDHDFAPHFIELLLRNRAPSWLKPIRTPTLRNYVVFEMQDAAPSDTKSDSQGGGKDEGAKIP